MAIEAGLLLPGRALGVIGIDTFQQLGGVFTAEEVGQRAELFEKDYAGSLKAMIGLLFHKDADPVLVADAEKRMMGTPPAAAKAMFLGMAGYDMGAAAARLAAPLRTINGDLYPTDIEANRKIKPDFDAVVMKHMGTIRCSSGPKSSTVWWRKRSPPSQRRRHSGPQAGGFRPSRPS